MHRSKRRGTYKSVLTAADIEWTSLIEYSSIFTTLGSRVTVRHAASATVCRPIAAVATGPAACTVTAWVIGITGIVISSTQTSSIFKFSMRIMPS